MTFRNVLLSQLQAERRRLSYSALTMFEAVMLAALTAAALKINASVESFLAGQVLGIVALVILTVLTDRRLLPTQATPEAQRREFRQKAFTYGMPFAPLAVGGWLANLADRYVLGIQLGAAAVGQYVAPLSIASRALILVNGALNDLFRPALFDAENRKQLADANKVFASWVAVNIAVGIAAVVAVAVFGEWVADVFLAQSYRAGAVHIMLWIASGYSIYGLTQVLETRILSLGRSAQLVAPMAAGALANVAFSWLLVSRQGILGAAQASCMSFAVQSLVTALFLRSALRQRRLVI
jgi:O-antigen/teichoic acid export membrane protein